MLTIRGPLRCCCFTGVPIGVASAEASWLRMPGSGAVQLFEGDGVSPEDPLPLLAIATDPFVGPPSPTPNLRTSSESAKHFAFACSAAKSIGRIVWMIVAMPSGVSAFGRAGGRIDRDCMGGRDRADGARPRCLLEGGRVAIAGVDGAAETAGPAPVFGSSCWADGRSGRKEPEGALPRRSPLSSSDGMDVSADDARPAATEVSER